MKQKSSKASDNMDKIVSALGEVVDAQMAFGQKLLESFTAGSGGVVKDMLNAAIGPKTDSCCDIPDPCWMPLSLGEIHCHLCPGASGQVCLVITNLDFRKRDFTIHAAGKDAAQVSFSTSHISLGPKERLGVTATFKAPTDNRTSHCFGQYEALIWVQGCRNHFLRWTVDTHSKSGSCCHEIFVNDQPDYELHWYDHFYFDRPCFGPKTIHFNKDKKG